jgi:putative Holliday junction resolvase
VAAPGVLLAVDPGQVRTGLAATDAGQMLASPVRTLSAAESVSGVVAECGAREAVAVVVGFPLSLSGAEGTAAALARSYAGRLASALASGLAPESEGAGTPVPVYLVDERLTTVSATAALRSAGHDSRSARRVVDQAAATALLQGVVDAAAAQSVDCLTLLAGGAGELVPAPPVRGRGQS